MNEIFDYKTASARLGVTEGTLRQWVHKKKIGYFKKNRKVYFTEKNLEDTVKRLDSNYTLKPTLYEAFKFMKPLNRFMKTVFRKKYVDCFSKLIKCKKRADLEQIAMDEELPESISELARDFLALDY